MKSLPADRPIVDVGAERDRAHPSHFLRVRDTTASPLARSCTSRRRRVRQEPRLALAGRKAREEHLVVAISPRCRRRGARRATRREVLSRVPGERVHLARPIDVEPGHLRCPPARSPVEDHAGDRRSRLGTWRRRRGLAPRRRRRSASGNRCGRVVHRATTSGQVSHRLRMMSERPSVTRLRARPG